MAILKALGAFAIVLLNSQRVLAQDCAETVADFRNASSQVRFTVEIADDAKERAIGLMFRESMPQFSGMLFVYEEPIDAVFWMHNTLISLDMVFMDETGVVTQIVAEAVPQTDVPRVGGPNVKFVLEVNGGLAEKLGLEIGSMMRNPAVDQTLAVWKCAG